MDKISGIIPSSARLSSVDMKDSSPVRPGVPSFGRPEGTSSLKPTDVLAVPAESTARKGIAAQEQLSDWRTKDAKQAALAAEVTDKFFMKNNRAAEPVQDLGQQVNLRQLTAAPVASTPAGFKNDQVSSRSQVVQPFEDEEPVHLQQPEGLYPKGSFIDRVA